MRELESRPIRPWIAGPCAYLKKSFVTLSTWRSFIAVANAFLGAARVVFRPAYVCAVVDREPRPLSIGTPQRRRHSGVPKP